MMTEPDRGKDRAGSVVRGAGPDEHQVRTWISCHRWTVLCMLAMAFLAVITRAERDRTTTPEG